VWQRAAYQLRGGNPTLLEVANISQSCDDRQTYAKRFNRRMRESGRVERGCCMELDGLDVTNEGGQPDRRTMSGAF
jgi:hypothetical protein